MKNKFFKNISYLVLSGFIVKILGLFNKIILIRFLGLSGISIYSLVMPTMMLFVVAGELSLPQAVSKVVSENIIIKPYSNRPILIKMAKIALAFSFFLILILISIAWPLSFYWLKNPDLLYPLLSIIPMIPIVPLTGILKGYFNGHKLMNITSIASLVEQVFRIISSFILINFFSKFNQSLAVCASIFTIAFGEASSLIYMIFKAKKITSLKINKSSVSVKPLTSIIVPSTLSRMTYSISNFFEPIVFTISLSKIGLSSRAIASYYASINAFAIPILVLLSFVSLSISVAFLPHLSESSKKNDLNKFNQIVSSGLKLSLIPAILITSILSFYPDTILSILYGTTSGSIYVRFMAPFFLLFYIESIMHVALEVRGYASKIFYINLFLSIIKLLSIYFLGIIPQINAYSLAYSTIINIVVTSIIYLLILMKDTHFRIKLYDFIKIFGLIILSYMSSFFLAKYFDSYVAIILSSTSFIFFFIILYRKKEIKNLFKF